MLIAVFLLVVAEDELFYSPKGKHSGTWALNRDKAAAWLKARELPEA
jgi:hypothetical protein